jgi:hypothetical protein
MAERNNERTAAIARQLQQAKKQRHAPGEKGQPERTRVHSSIYLERDLLDRLGKAYKATNHELYPLEVRKSTFIEACIAYALDHLSDIKNRLLETTVP